MVLLSIAAYATFALIRSPEGSECRQCAEVLFLPTFILPYSFFTVEIQLRLAQSDGNGLSGLVWVFWLPIDFPISLLIYLDGPLYSAVLDRTETFSPLLAQALYGPYLLTGFLGTIWWFFVPSVFRWITTRFSNWLDAPAGQ
jgi:hypothetical protein